jgi:hypothetical protein
MTKDEARRIAANIANQGYCASRDAVLHNIAKALRITH